MNINELKQNITQEVQKILNGVDEVDVDITKKSAWIFVNNINVMYMEVRDYMQFGMMFSSNIYDFRCKIELNNNTTKKDLERYKNIIKVFEYFTDVKIKKSIANIIDKAIIKLGEIEE